MAAEILRHRNVVDLFKGLLFVLPISIIVGLAAVIARFRASSKGPQRSQYASVIKKVIGFDFGDDFRFFRYLYHDEEYYDYVFSESSFEPLKMHLNTIPDEERTDDTGCTRCICHQYKDGQCSGFILEDSRLEYGCGNIESIEVNYEKRTLRHSFVIY